MSEMDGDQVAPFLLLTGAGFTSNFGGFLPSEMHEKIFNRVSADPDLLSAMNQELDFESAYRKIMAGAFSAESKALMDDAVFSAYESLDAGIREWNFALGSPHPVNIYEVRKLLHRFAGTRRQSAFIFTLNQDLFVERHYADEPIPLVLSGFGRPARFRGLYPSLMERQGLSRGEFLTMPTVAEAAAQPGFFYVKLHGSYGWQGADAMVIGGAKLSTIAASPLLASYLDLFEASLRAGGRKLLVIGYSFRDPHVNAAIWNAVQESGLEVFVWDRSPPPELASRPDVDEAGSHVLHQCRGYWTTPMSEVYPADQSFTPRNKEFQETFFGSVLRS